jgi:hypothetical protein
MLSTLYCTKRIIYIANMNWLQNLFSSKPLDPKLLSTHSETTQGTDVVARPLSLNDMPKNDPPVAKVLTLKECFEPATGKNFDETLPDTYNQLQIKRGVTIEQIVAAA